MRFQEAQSHKYIPKHNEEPTKNDESLPHSRTHSLPVFIFSWPSLRNSPAVFSPTTGINSRVMDRGKKRERENWKVCVGHLEANSAIINSED